ncbi:MAG: aldehyde dehydrogenase family protein [Myxococcales bacterium]|nr:aldehyde dehydrogenase family protein [Myxococcales bacterium]
MTEASPLTPTMSKGSAAIPEADHRVAPSTPEEMDAALRVLRDKADEWVALSIDERIGILEELVESTYRVSERWAREACQAKGIPLGTPAEGEEWLGGPAVVLRNLNLLIRSLKDIREHGAPQLPKKPWVRPNGQVVAPVFPTDKWDALSFTGFSAEVWMDPSVTPSTLAETMGVFYRRPPAKGKVALVLGAGNVSSIGAMDALYKLFAEGEVVALKMNPVNEYLGPITDEAFRELVRRGYLRVLYGGAAEGERLCTHELVDTIHITGSDKTHDAIVWGLGPEGEERKRRREPRNTRPVTSELGNVSPILVVPGPWTQADLDYQGVNLASSLTNNAGFNCNASRVFITHAGWNQRTALLDAVKRAFAKATSRAPYYPGAEQRHKAFVDAHPNAFQFGPAGEGRVPWTFITDLDPTKTDDPCFQVEAWCGVTSEVPLSASDPVEFIRQAVAFANDTLWGTLSCSIIVHPKSLKDPRVAKAVDDAIADLRYGSVAVNHWSALSYAFVSTTWGAYPGHELHDIRSGRGVVHNSYLFDRPQKSVVRGPFRVAPKPAWFVDNRNAHRIGRALTDFNHRPGLARLPKLVFEALKG